MSSRDCASPGGPGLSDAKRRRLAALESTLASSRKAHAGPAEKKRSDRGTSIPAQQPGKKRQKAAAGAARAAGRPHAEQSQEAAEAACLPPYDPLCTGIRESVLSKTPQQGGAKVQGDVVRALLESLMLTNPKTASTRAVLGLRLQDKNIMLENPTAPTKAPPKRQSQLLSGVKRRQLGLDQLRPEHMKYSLLQPLHQLWQRYVGEVLRSGVQASLEERLLQLDLHGCLLRVVRHRDSRLVGQQGIVVRYSSDVFHIVSPADRLVRVRRVPDAEVQFQLSDRQAVSLRS